MASINHATCSIRWDPAFIGLHWHEYINRYRGAGRGVFPEVRSLHVEYAERRIKYGILFIFSPFCEYGVLEYVHVPVEYRGHHMEYVVRIRVAAPQEYVNTYSPRRVRFIYGLPSSHKLCS